MSVSSRNDVLLEGIPLTAPEWSHENHGSRFYRLSLQVSRLSGTPDILPLLLPESPAAQISPGTPLRIRGQLRSFNNRSGVGSKLVLSVYPRVIEPALGESCNQIVLSGSLCKTPIFRHTPLGRSICDLMLAVPRKYGRADYLPVIAWGQLAAEVSQLQVGDPLALEGRIQSRLYQKATEHGTEERTAYEVSMMHILSE